MLNFDCKETAFHPLHEAISIEIINSRYNLPRNSTIATGTSLLPIPIINAQQGAGKGQAFAEPDEHRLMYLARRLDNKSGDEQTTPESGDDKRRPKLRRRRRFVLVILFHARKVTPPPPPATIEFPGTDMLATCPKPHASLSI